KSLAPTRSCAPAIHIAWRNRNNVQPRRATALSYFNELSEMHNGDPRQKGDANDDCDDQRTDRSDQWHADVLRDSWRGRAAAAVAWLHGRRQQLASVRRRFEPGVSTHHSRP